MKANTDPSEDAKYIIARLKANDKIFAQHFFYDDNPKELNISRIRSKIICEIAKSYKINIAKRDFSSLVYEAIWSDGTWAPLDTFKFHSSIFSWLEKIARHEIVSHLEEIGWITVPKTRTAANTRIKFLSQSPLRCKQVIDEIITEEEQHNLLTMLYVERKTEEQIEVEMNLSQDDFEKLCKKAELKLKDGILRSPHNYDDMLGDRGKRIITVSPDYADEFAEWLETKIGEEDFRDVFGVNLTHEQIQDLCMKLLKDISANMDWSAKDRYLWQRRYFEDGSPEELAKELGMRRSNVDVKYSRMRVKFYEALNKWWEKNGK